MSLRGVLTSATDRLTRSVSFSFYLHTLKEGGQAPEAPGKPNSMGARTGVPLLSVCLGIRLREKQHKFK